jgi:hypothetical protein
VNAGAQVTLQALVKKLHPIMTFAFAAVIEAGLIIGALFMGSSWSNTIITLAILAFGFAVGSVMGTAVSPSDEKESKRFSTYAKAVAVFFTGYLASKLDGAINAALPILNHPTPLNAFRILAFATTVLLVAKATFACRSYD